MLLLCVVAVYGRCQQMERAKNRAIGSGIVALARTIEAGNDDFAEAERAFLSAATESVRDVYPRFCLSAIRELRGEQPVEQPPPEGWTDAVALLANNRLHEARAAFDAFLQAEPPWLHRAGLYQRLIDDLLPRLTAGAP